MTLNYFISQQLILIKKYQNNIYKFVQNKILNNGHISFEKNGYLIKGYEKKNKFFKKKTPIIIAEMSGNHNGSLKQALKIAKEAAKAGADAIKLQTYTADTITLNSKNRDFIIHDKKTWKKERLYNLYKKAHTPWSQHKKIFNLAKKLNIVCFSSPFDETAVDFLEKLNTPIYKIASFEITHLPLIKKLQKQKTHNYVNRTSFKKRN